MDKKMARAPEPDALNLARDKNLWVFASEGSRMLGLHHSQFLKIAAAAGFRTRVLPGMRIRYYRPDVEAIALASVESFAVEGGAGRMSFQGAPARP